MHPHRRRRFSPVLHCLPLLGGLLVAACSRDTAGPEGIAVRLAINPVFNTAGGMAAAGIVDIARTRVRLEHADESPALDSVIVVPEGADSVLLEAQVAVTTAGESLVLTVAFITPAGDTAFYGGPVTVQTGSSSAAPVLVDLPTVYVGVGANAVGVQITNRAAFVAALDSVTLTAEAYDGNQQVIPGTPIAWRSLNTNVATVPDPAVGTIVGGTAAGSALIVAELLTGPADTISATVTAYGTGTVLVLSNSPGGNAAIRDSFPPYMPGFTFDTMDVSAQTPTLAFLRQYRLVLLYEDGLFPNAINVGDTVAAYVQAGGNLVIGTFYWQDRSDNLEFAGTTASWGALETLDPFLGPFGSEYRPDSLYVPSLVAHPMTAGLTALWVAQFHGGVQAKAGTVVVAEWSDACDICKPDIRTPLIGYRTGALNQRIVAVSTAPQYPAYSTPTAAVFSGDFYALWANVLGWAIVGGPPPTGTAAAGAWAAGTTRSHPAIGADRTLRQGGSFR
jgi:hypothetical protein